jgi:hypothetical protein
MRQGASIRNRGLIALSILLVGVVVATAIVVALAPTLLPVGDRIAGDGRSIAASVIFIGSYLALAIGRIPGLSIDRAGIALVGAGLMVASGALSLEDARVNRRRSARLGASISRFGASGQDKTRPAGEPIATGPPSRRSTDAPARSSAAPVRRRVALVKGSGDQAGRDPIHAGAVFSQPPWLVRA